jgi:isopentenyl-diphosphate delta-isomerase
MTPATEFVILIDGKNRRLGEAEKMMAHREGLLHRAFSIFLVDGVGRILLQKRAATKYHSAGLWSNTCCGHPRPGERTQLAARRRLREELGIEGVDLRLAFRASYCANLDNGLTENEHVYVYFGAMNKFRCAPNPTEVSEVQAVPLTNLLNDVHRRPKAYSAWLAHYLIQHPREIASAAEQCAHDPHGTGHRGFA